MLGHSVCCDRRFCLAAQAPRRGTLAPGADTRSFARTDPHADALAAHSHATCAHRGPGAQCCSDARPASLRIRHRCCSPSTRIAHSRSYCACSRALCNFECKCGVTTIFADDAPLAYLLACPLKFSSDSDRTSERATRPPWCEWCGVLSVYFV